MAEYHALIVDDELASRETLRRLVDWQRLGFAPPVLAENGQKALEALRDGSFEVVLTDIEMPVMNGISLIGHIREEFPAQKVVIISCHEKFSYAQQALRLGVADYLIKDLVTPNELTALLCAITLEVGTGVGNRPKRELGALLAAAVAEETPEEGPLPCGYSAVFCVVLDEFERLALERGRETMAGAAAELLSGLDCAAYHWVGKGLFYLLIPLPNSANSMLYFLNAAITVSGAVRAAAKKAGFRSASIGVSDPVSEAPRLPAACAQAAEAAEMRIITGLDRTAVYNTIQLKKGVVDYKYTEYLLRRIADLGYNANTACLRLVDKLYAIDLSSGLADIHYYRYINARLWVICIHVAQSRGREYTTALEGLGKDVEEVDRMENSAQMAGFFKAFLAGLFSGELPTKSEGVVDQALRLIEQEYTKDISLGDIAERLHTNKSYLSRTFKEQTGQNLMRYLVDKKITRAKYLLCNTQMKLYEVSESVGFASPQYFSLVFKRHTGFPPNEYKRAMETPGIWMKYLMDQDSKGKNGQQ